MKTTNVDAKAEYYKNGKIKKMTFVFDVPHWMSVDVRAFHASASAVMTVLKLYSKKTMKEYVAKLIEGLEQKEPGAKDND